MSDKPEAGDHPRGDIHANKSTVGNNNQLNNDSHVTNKTYSGLYSGSQVFVTNIYKLSAPGSGSLPGTHRSPTAERGASQTTSKIQGNQLSRPYTDKEKAQFAAFMAKFDCDSPPLYYRPYCHPAELARSRLAQPKSEPSWCAPPLPKPEQSNQTDSKPSRWQVFTKFLGLDHHRNRTTLKVAVSIVGPIAIVFAIYGALLKSHSLHVSQQDINQIYNSMTNGQCWNGVSTLKTDASTEDYVLVDKPRIVPCEDYSATMRRVRADNCKDCYSPIPVVNLCTPAKRTPTGINFRNLIVSCDSARAREYPDMLKIVRISSTTLSGCPFGATFVDVLFNPGISWTNNFCYVFQ